jgi:hypothetical protein
VSDWCPISRVACGVFAKGNWILMIGLSETIAALNFLLNLYKLRREGRTPQPTDPDPDKVERVIKELELRLEDQIPPPQDAVAKQIDESLPPEQAKRLQVDLVLVEFLASAPEAHEYDYWNVLQSYVTKVQQLASRAQLFLSHGQQSATGVRVFELKKTSQVLLTPEAATRALRPDGTSLSAWPKSVYVGLTDERDRMPLLIILTASFGKLPDGLGYSSPPEKDAETFRLEMGEAPNWLGFVPVKVVAADNLLHRHRFHAIEYRLSASDLQKILEALGGDLMDYINESKNDREILRKIRMELADFMKIG